MVRPEVLKSGKPSVTSRLTSCCRPVSDRRGNIHRFDPCDRREAFDDGALPQPLVGPNQWPAQVPAGQWPAICSAGPWPAQGCHSAIGRVKASAGQWPAQFTRPLAEAKFQSANGRPKGHTRPLAEAKLQPANGRPSSLGHWPRQSFSRPMADPNLFTRPMGRQTTPWLPINTGAAPPVQVIHS